MSTTIAWSFVALRLSKLPRHRRTPRPCRALSFRTLASVPFLCKVTSYRSLSYPAPTVDSTASSEETKKEQAEAGAHPFAREHTSRFHVAARRGRRRALRSGGGFWPRHWHAAPPARGQRPRHAATPVGPRRAACGGQRAGCAETPVGPRCVACRRPTDGAVPPAGAGRLWLTQISRYS